MSEGRYADYERGYRDGLTGRPRSPGADIERAVEAAAIALETLRYIDLQPDYDHGEYVEVARLAVMAALESLGFDGTGAPPESDL